jgi:hypothetical protein
MTSERVQLDLLIASLRARGDVPDPAIEPLEPVIRSSDQFIFPGNLGQANTVGGGGNVLDTIKARLDPAHVAAGDVATYGPADPTDTQVLADYKAVVRKTPYLGLVVVEYGYDIKPFDPEAPEDKHNAFRSWLLDNEADLAASCPSGVRYRGTYAVLTTSEKTAGQYRTIWSFRGGDAIRALMQEVVNDTECGELVKQLRAWVDESPGAGSSQQQYVLGAGSRHIFTAYDD